MKLPSLANRALLIALAVGGAACGGATAPANEPTDVSLKTVPSPDMPAEKPATSQAAAPVSSATATADTGAKGASPSASPSSAPAAAESPSLAAIQGALALAKHPNSIRAAAAYGGDVYWVHGNGVESLRSDGSSISKVSRAGGTAKRVTPPPRDTGSQGWMLPTAAGIFYVVDQVDSRGEDWIVSLPLAGGTPTKLAKWDDPLLAASSSHLYWSSNAFEAETKGPTLVERMPLAGGATERLLTLPEGVVLRMAYDNDNLYLALATANFKKHTLNKLSVKGGALQQLADLPVGVDLHTMVLRGKQVYFHTSDSKLLTYSTAGGAAKTIAAPKAGCDARVHGTYLVTDSHVFWVESGKVKRCLLGGGKVETLFSGLGSSGSVGSLETRLLALDGDRLLFTSPNAERTEAFLLSLELAAPAQ